MFAATIKRGFGVLLIVGLSSFVLTACETTTADIDSFANSINGEARIADAISDPAVEMDVKIYGVLKLVKLRRFDLLSHAIEMTAQEDRLNLIKNCALDIGKLLQVPDIKVQAAAKDTLYLFMTLGGQGLVESSAKQAILIWYENDFLKKYAMGKFSAFHVLSKIGADSGDLLVKILQKESGAFIKVAKIVEKIDDTKLNAKISDLLIKWFDEQKPNLSPKLLDLACYVRDDRLTELLNNYITNKKHPQKTRRNAFNTLTFHPSRLSVPAATKIYIDRKEDIDMRGIALELFKKVGDKSILKYLYPFLKDEDVKWGTFAIVLKLGGSEVVEKVFSGLNPRVEYWREDYDIARKQLKKLDKDAAVSLQKFLKSKHVPIVILALIGLQYTADKDMATENIEPMIEDKRVIKHYMSGKKFTIGDMAKAVMLEIK